MTRDAKEQGAKEIDRVAPKERQSLTVRELLRIAKKITEDQGGTMVVPPQRIGRRVRR